LGAAAVIAIVVASQQSWLYAVYAIGAAAMIWLFHIDNIQRLLAGTERRIEFRR
jgi:glycerol-3-phosphate acyltransferase PlsY